MLRSALAIISGYILASSTQVIAMLTLDSAFGYELHDPQLDPAPAWIIINFLIAFICYFVGAWTTALIARTDIMRHAGYFIGIILVFNVVGLITQRGAQPFWFSLSMIAVPIIAVVVASRLRAARTGDLQNSSAEDTKTPPA